MIILLSHLVTLGVYIALSIVSNPSLPKLGYK